MLKAGEQTMSIGNITLNNLKAAKSNKGDVVTFNDSIKIENGDDPTITWVGPSLPKIPLKLKLLVNEEKLYTLIDIDMQKTLGQTIHVTFGDNYQLPNSGFEDYRTEQITKLDDSYKQITVNVEEPLNWHSFASATGDFVQAANALSDPHTFPPTSYAVALRARRVCCSPRPLSLALSQTALSPQDACRQEP